MLKQIGKWINLQKLSGKNKKPVTTNTHCRSQNIHGFVRNVENINTLIKGLRAFCFLRYVMDFENFIRNNNFSEIKNQLDILEQRVLTSADEVKRII